MKSFLVVIIFSLSLFSISALADTPMFTPDEIQKHQDNIKVITATAAKCLSDTYAEHVAFFKKWNVSKFYGSRKKEYFTEAQRRAALRQYGAPESLVSELESTSCIGLTMKCLAQGFKATGTEKTWAKIYAKLAIDQNFYGTDLQIMLSQLGWKILYWNPDPSQNAAWDRDDLALNPLKPGKKWNPVWGGHAYRYAQVLKNRSYYGIPVDDANLLVGFKTTLPQEFLQVPFFVGTAHAGYHVFPGKMGKVIEAHSMRNLNAFDNLEVSMFNPLETGGGPRWTRTEKYRSGVIAIPPR